MEESYGHGWNKPFHPDDKQRAWEAWQRATRYFVGLTFEEAAATLGIAVPTAKEWWAHARAWLRVEISQQHDGH